MDSGDSIKRTICTFCNCNCGVLVHVRDGRIVRITGNPANAISGGYVCRRIKYAIKWLYHPPVPVGVGRWSRTRWGRTKISNLDNKWDAVSL